MLRVGIAQAKAGMSLAIPVYHPARPASVLLNEGVRLDDRMVARMRELGVRQLWIRYPGMEFLAEFVSPHVIRAQAETVASIREVLDAVERSAHARLEYLDYRAAISGLLARLAEHPRATLYIQEMVEHDQPALRHAANVCMISLMMGIRLEPYVVAQRDKIDPAAAKDVSNLGVGGMMHDVGMLRLDRETLDRWNRTHDESDHAWREHVRIGYEMVQGAIGPTASAAVLHHHQKFDGSGFPKRITLEGREACVAGSDIHIFARIIAAADLYDRLRHTADAPGAEAHPVPSIPVVRALGMMLRPPYRDWIDPMVFRGLLAVVPAYAPGTLVSLSNGRQGVVVDWSSSDPCRPVVREVGDVTRGFDRAPRAGELFDLRTTPDLSVVTCEGVDVSRANFHPTTPGQFDLDLANKAVGNAAVRMDEPPSAAA
jgi:HD-GYP domain-containing protein (c-di-GMP phosphodiesterase class II)